ncbi:hypothetical protein F5890DRAFT_1478491, partial [Lentinula detonsa]
MISQMRLLQFLLPSLFFIFAIMAHYCLKECPKGVMGHGFPSARALTQHRLKCKFAKASLVRDRITVTAPLHHPSLQPKKVRVSFPKRTGHNNPGPSTPSQHEISALPEPLHLETSDETIVQSVNGLEIVNAELQIALAAPQCKQMDSYPPTQITASGRASRMPRRFRDELPQAQPAVVAGPTPEEAPQTLIRRVTLIIRDQLKTAANPFGLIRHYLHRPSYDPDAIVPINELCNRRERFNVPEGSEGEIVDAEPEDHQAPWPFSNMSTWRLMSWANSGGRTKSELETTRLVNDVLLQEDFDPTDLKGFDAL